MSYSCELIPSDIELKKAAPKDDWPAYVCDKFDEEYQDINLKIISERSTRNVEKELIGFFKIDSVRAGRAKVAWSSSDNMHKSEIWVSLKGKKKVWVFNKNLTPGKTIRKRDVKESFENVAHFAGVTELPEKSPVGKVLLKRARKGKVITSSFISEPPLIEKNDKVRVTVEYGSVKISSKARALEDGWKVGDRIKIKVDSAEEPVTAIVEGDKLVYVDF